MTGIDFDPLITSGLVGLVWPLIQAALDRPWWTPTRRRLLVLTMGLLLSMAVWAVGTYPLTWQLITTQASVIIAAAATAFTILKHLGVIDWIGQITPGGEDYTPKHAKETPDGH